MDLVLVEMSLTDFPGYFTTTDDIYQWAKNKDVNLQDKVVIVTGTLLTPYIFLKNARWTLRCRKRSSKDFGTLQGKIVFVGQRPKKV